MRRLILTTLLALFAVALYAAQRSTTLVYIDGQRYYVHKVEPQQTLYSLTKLYGVEQNAIIESNPQIVDGLKSDSYIKIPYTLSQADEPSRSERRRYDEHEVKAGETLYSISRKYAISISVIINDNPTIDPIALSVGDKLLINKREQGESDELKSHMEWERYRDNLNKVAPEGYKFHLVTQGETIYSLARQYEMSEQDIIDANDLSSGLKMGTLIAVIDKDWIERDNSASHADNEIRAHGADIEFAPKGEKERLRVALFLPLKSKGSVRAEFVEFYNGFLLGLEDIKEQHPQRHITIDLYNSGRDRATVAKIASSEEFAGTDLIIGPIYQDCIEELIPYAERNAVPIVSPLSQIRDIESGVLFQMAAESKNRYDKIGDLLSSSKRVTFIHTESVDSTFYKQIVSMMESDSIYSHTYVYEHQDVTRELLKQDSERISPSDLTPFIANGLDNTIVITANNQTDVDRVLAALTSANTNQMARSRTRPQYRVLGNSSWNNYSSIDRSLLFSNGVVLFPSYEARRSSSQSVIDFDRRYILEYGKVPSLYSYRGYDAASIFINGAYSQIEYKMQGNIYQPLQSQYIFSQNESSGVITNTNSQRINYNKDFTITVE